MGPLMQTTEFVESYFDAWNHSDPKGVADHLVAGGTYFDIPENVLRSRDELIANLDDFFSRYRHRYELIGKILADDKTIAFQYQVYPLSEGNQSTIYRGAEFMTLRGDAAMTISDYYDNPSVSGTSSAKLSELAANEAQRNKYAKSGLNRQQLLEYKQRLAEIMQTNKAYLQPSLTLPKLARAVDCSVNHLSQVINAGFGMSFFDYLNQHRIAHAQKLLTQPNDKNGAILNVAFTVGFNSNSAFYAAFKKCVGQTPAQYRRSHLLASCS